MEEGARAVKEEANHWGNPRLTALPYNRFDRTTSTWWLSPSRDNPAYKYGKIAFVTKDFPAGHIFIGLYVEKGVGPSAWAAFSGGQRARRCIMDDTWLWHRFVRALETGVFEQLARQVQAEAESELLIALDSAAVPPPETGDWEVQRYSVPSDFVQFSFSDGRLRQLNSRLDYQYLTELQNARTLDNIAVQIRDLDQLDWHWIDFHAGFLFRQKPRDDRDLKSHAALEIWRKAVRPWSEWLA
jgi:hypothetical protein